MTDALRASGERIESLLEASAAGGTVARGRAEDLVACVSELYGAGLARMLEILERSGRLDEWLLGEFAGDELVASLLLVHDLHPYDVATRVGQALDAVRPYLGSHGGDVELLGVDADGVVRLRLLGSCDGCPSSSVTLELAVQEAVAAAAPEMTRIEVEASRVAAPPRPVISLGSLRARLDPPAAGPSGTWVEVPELESLRAGQLAGFQVAGLDVCACRLGAELYCFQDRCGHCEQSLAGAVIERRLGDPVGTGVLRCAKCRSHYDIRRAGAGLDDPGEHLLPLPVLPRAGTMSIAIPTVLAS